MYQDWVWQYWFETGIGIFDGTVMDHPTNYENMYPQDFPSLLGCE